MGAQISWLGRARQQIPCALGIATVALAQGRTRETDAIDSALEDLLALAASAAPQLLSARGLGSEPEAEPWLPECVIVSGEHIMLYEYLRVGEDLALVVVCARGTNIADTLLRARDLQRTLGV